MNISSIVKTTVLAAMAATLMQSAQAQDAKIDMQIAKAGLVIGVAGGNGTLTYQDQQYPLTISGVSFGLTIGVSAANLTGNVNNLNAIEDIEGSYGGGEAAIAVIGGGRTMKLTNAKGVELELSGGEAGIEASLVAQGMTIKLK